MLNGKKKTGKIYCLLLNPDITQDFRWMFENVAKLSVEEDFPQLRWVVASRKKERFLTNDVEWLTSSIQLPNFSAETAQISKRPSKRFKELSDSSKRRKTMELRKQVPVEQLVYAASVSQCTSGNTDASVIIKEITSIPTRATKSISPYKSIIFKRKQVDVKKHTPQETLAIFVEGDFTTRQWEIFHVFSSLCDWCQNKRRTSTIIWQNSVPSSVRFCKPIRIRLISETKDITKEEKPYIENQVQNLTETQIQTPEEIVKIKHPMLFTVVDGKVCNAATDIASNYALLCLAYQLPLQKWQALTLEEKKTAKQTKEKILRGFKEEMGFLVDVPNAGNLTSPYYFLLWTGDRNWAVFDDEGLTSNGI
ncbi:hypothetical protein ILUMI_11929 [Ignelater luminosus]|uniref:Uncharacterized protein n=1 Tax=Ignelater luminosus TaxID=2038154 RepID=A0A8K0CXI3_IGNLU|nr:hypothetical protein ILUMI_11929 [Ignelater luminosus]